METEEITSKPKKSGGFKRFVRILILVVILLALGISAFLYFGIYDEGVRAGVVVRISKKGVMFKTYEGQLNMETFGAIKGNTPFVQSFDFSVAKDRQDIVKELEAVSLSGERVNLHYIKRYLVFPWRGNTKYFIEDVERLNKKPETQEPQKEETEVQQE